MAARKRGNPCRNQESEQVLLLEGKDDCHVVMAFCKHHNLPESFGIYECGNWNGVLQNLNALILGQDPKKSIGIVMDADNSLSSRWQQIINKVKRHGYDFSPAPDPAGSIVRLDERPDLGIWLMPNNQDSGMLEDFLLEMADPKAMASARKCVEQAREEGVSTFREAHRSKAEIHTYLAWQDEPGKPLGQSITSHALSPDSPTTESFKGWLQRLFEADR